MDFKEVSYGDAQPFDGYGPGVFRVGGTLHRGDLMVAVSGVRPWGGYDDAATLLALREEVDVILIGTGETLAHIPAPLRTALEDAGIGVEPMATPSACRTYNVLLGEGRRVAAAVLAI